MNKLVRATKISDKLWILDADFLVLNSKIPINFIFDGMSIPKTFRFIDSPMTGSHVVYSIWHDFQYSKDSKSDLSRSQIDKIYAETFGGIKKSIIQYSLTLCAKRNFKRIYSIEKFTEALINDELYDQAFKYVESRMRISNGTNIKTELYQSESEYLENDNVNSASDFSFERKKRENSF